MPSSQRTRIAAILSLVASLSACASVPIAAGCSELAKGVLTVETPHAVIGDTGDAALDWQLYGVSETGQLNTANDRAATGYSIIAQCEVRDAEIVNRPWWRR